MEASVNDKRSLGFFPKSRKSWLGMDRVEVGPGCLGRARLVTCNFGVDEDGGIVRPLLTRLFLSEDARLSFADFRLFVNGTCDSLSSGAPGCLVPECVELGNILLPHGGGGDVVEVEARNHTGAVQVLRVGLEVDLARMFFVEGGRDERFQKSFSGGGRGHA